MTQLDLLADLPPDPDDQPAPAEPEPGSRDAYLHPSCEVTRTCPHCVKMRTSPLTTSLQLAVPLWIWEANQRTGETRAELLAAWRADASDVIPEQGDNILYIGHKKGETAKAFNSLARGMAALACHTGGYRALALTWCAQHSPGGAIPTGPVCGPCADQHGDQPIVCDCCTVTAPVPPPHPAYVGPRAVKDIDTGGLT